MRQRLEIYRSRVALPDHCRAWLAALAAIALPLTVHAQAPPTTQVDPRSAKGAIRLLFHNAALRLPDTPSCRGVDTTGIVNPTLGDWLAGILAELRPATGTSGVSAGCEGEIRALRCHVHVSRASGEEVWRWGVTFAANGHTGTIQASTIRCASAG